VFLEHIFHRTSRPPQNQDELRTFTSGHGRANLFIMRLHGTYLNKIKICITLVKCSLSCAFCKGHMHLWKKDPKVTANVLAKKLQENFPNRENCTTFQLICRRPCAGTTTMPKRRAPLIVGIVVVVMHEYNEKRERL
jgi:hypothetical protein